MTNKLSRRNLAVSYVNYAFAMCALRVVVRVTLVMALTIYYTNGVNVRRADTTHTSNQATSYFPACQRTLDVAKTVATSYSIDRLIECLFMPSCVESNSRGIDSKVRWRVGSAVLNNEYATHAETMTMRPRACDESQRLIRSSCPLLGAIQTS